MVTRVFGLHNLSLRNLAPKVTYCRSDAHKRELFFSHGLIVGGDKIGREQTGRRCLAAINAPHDSHLAFLSAVALSGLAILGVVSQTGH